MSSNTNFLDVSRPVPSFVPPSPSSLDLPPPSSRSTTSSFSLSRLPLTDEYYRVVQKACEIVKQAIDADVKQEWAEAFKLYKLVLLSTSQYSPLEADLSDER